MIRLERPPIEAALDDDKRAALAERQSAAAQLPAGSKTITSRWDSFRQGKGRDSGVGPHVCEQILAFCGKKCAFCEAPSPATVDHFWPKTDYPSRMFQWDNLLAACRDCNCEKRTKFSLDGQGKPLLLDPTADEPLLHFRWDKATGECLYEQTNPRATETAAAIAMDRFQNERLQKLRLVLFLFTQCLENKPAPDELRERVRAELDPSRPYLCILRSYFLYPPNPHDRTLVREAIRALPEILEWVRPWLRPPAGVVWPG